MNRNWHSKKQLKTFGYMCWFIRTSAYSLILFPLHVRLSHHSRQLRGSCHGRCRGAGGLEDLLRAFYEDFMEYHEDIYIYMIIYEDINWMILDVWRILMDSYMIEAESWPTMAGSYWIPMAPTGKHSGKIEQFSCLVFVFLNISFFQVDQ